MATRACKLVFRHIEIFVLSLIDHLMLVGSHKDDVLRSSEIWQNHCCAKLIFGTFEILKIDLSSVLKFEVFLLVLIQCGIVTKMIYSN